MDKIKRFRNAQTISFEEFFNYVTDKGICEYCDDYEECLEAMGEENIQYMSGNGCGAFDSSVDNIKKHFLLEKCIQIGT
jgi:hypothetical protein